MDSRIKIDRNDLTKQLRVTFLNKIPEINKMLIFCTENKCSDLYIKVGEEPYISRYGVIYKVPSFEVTNKVWNEWATYAISSERNSIYVREKMLDFSYELPHNDDVYRYRVSSGFSNGKSIATFRMISKNAPSFDNINFPRNIRDILYQIAERRNKITLYVGATGSGKSTTMTASINDFSKNDGPFKNSVLISLEDPIEYILNGTEHTKIIQKELGVDFKNFPNGIKQALREHPNFINVGETRDKETIVTLIEASRTGHGVYSSFHATDVADTMSRLYNHSSNNGDKSVMYDLVANFNLILCQRISPKNDYFELNTQYMVFTPNIVDYLNDSIEKNKNIPTVINKLFKNEKLIQSGVIKDWD